EVDRFDRRNHISSDRRPTVLTDSSLDDDTDNDNRSERKLPYAAKTPRRPKPYEQSRSKRHDVTGVTNCFFCECPLHNFRFAASRLVIKLDVDSAPVRASCSSRCDWSLCTRHGDI